MAALLLLLILGQLTGVTATRPPWPREGEIGAVEWEGLTQRFLPRGVNTTECMFAAICILKYILKAPRSESSVFYSIFL